MFTFVAILTGLAMLTTVGILIAGMLGLSRGESSGRRSNRLMQARVLSQGVTLMLVAVLLWMARH